MKPELLKDGAMEKVVEAANPRDREKQEEYAFMFFNGQSDQAKKDEVQKMIDENDVIIFSKTYCPYCTAAKNTLNSKIHSSQVNVKIVELDNPEGEALHTALKEISGQRTVPNIYVKGKHIGGNDDLNRKILSGEMKKICDEALIPNAF
jgi:glutaredoxin 3